LLRTLAFLLGTLALTATPASAALPAPFGSEGEGAGQFSSPRGIAVDQESGDVYIGDRENRRVDKFGPKGEFLLAWGWGVGNGAAEPQTCGPEGTSATCRSGVPGEGAGQFGEQSVVGVAVDNSLDFSHGDVYVEDSANHRIEKFGPEGKFILMFGGEVNRKTKGDVCLASEECKSGKEGAGPGEFEGLLQPSSIAVNTAGTVYVGDGIEAETTARLQEFGEGGTRVGQFTVKGLGIVTALAVASAEEVYVVGTLLGGVHEYDGAGVEVGKPRDPAVSYFGTVVALGASRELFVFDAESGHVLEYEQSGAQIASFRQAGALEPTGFARGIAFGDGVGGLYVLYDQTVQFAAPPPPGPVVVAGSEATSGILPITATVSARVNAEGHETTYHFEYDTKPYEQGEAPHGASTTATLLPGGEGFEDQSVSAPATGLAPRTVYHFRVVAGNECEPIEHHGKICTTDGPDQTFETLPPISIESESVSKTTATSARLEAQLDPHSLPTDFHFEYLTEAQFQANGESFSGTSYKPISAPDEPEGEAGEGTSDVPLSVLVEDLTPGTTYHYRVVASNECEPVAHPGVRCVIEGADRTFTTQAGVGEGLIDGRGWELVSEPDKHGQALEAITKEGGIIQAAENGSGLAYIAQGPPDSEPEGNRSIAEQQLLATRGGDGWSTQDIATPHETVAGLVGGRLSEYRIFSPDLSVGLVEPEGQTPLSALASEPTPYLRSETSCTTDPSTCYDPLVTANNVLAGTKFGTVYERGTRNAGSGVEFAGATPDLSHVVLTAPESLTAGFDAGTGHEAALYEWPGREVQPGRVELEPISILPDETSAGVEGGARLGADSLNVRGAISADGSRVFWATATHLYMRDTMLKKTLQLDLPEPGCTLAGKCVVVAGEPKFQIASSDGSRVFFTDERDLTSEARAREGKPDLYECEVLEPAPGQLACVLSDLTVDHTAGEAADVQGVVLGASERGCDVGSHEACEVYFVANGALTADAAPGDCNNLGGDFCNLYVYDADTGVTTLVAALPGSDYRDWEAGSEPNLGEVTARVSANGRYLAFMSQRSLTGYDNEDASSGSPGERLDEEVYEYDAGSGGAGSLACASCDPTGARPQGVLEPGGTEAPLLADRSDLWPGRWLAGSVPGWTPVEKTRALYQSRYLDDNGRLFFDSPVALVPGDGNGKEDVYEWEPAGAGPPSASCGAGGPGSSGADQAFKTARAYEAPNVSGAQPLSGVEPAGCVGLISSGSSSEESAFLDASGMGPGGEEGEDVFFLTAAKLAPQDFDSALDVYDAHVCSTAAPCPQATVTVPPACTNADSCRAPAAPQPEVFGAPASATLGGPGNVPAPPPAVVKPKAKPLTRAQKLSKALKACHKKPKKKRASCERQAHKRFGPAKKANGSSNDRRSS